MSTTRPIPTWAFWSLLAVGVIWFTGPYWWPLVRAPDGITATPPIPSHGRQAISSEPTPSGRILTDGPQGYRLILPPHWDVSWVGTATRCRATFPRGQAAVRCHAYTLTQQTAREFVRSYARSVAESAGLSPAEAAWSTAEEGDRRLILRSSGAPLVLGARWCSDRMVVVEARVADGDTTDLAADVAHTIASLTWLSES